MTPAARYQATIELLEGIADKSRPADSVANAYFRARRYMGSKDRAATSAIFYDIIRHVARLSWRLGQFRQSPTPRLLTMAYIVDVEAMNADDVRVFFNGGQFAPSALDEEEQKTLQSLTARPLDIKKMPLDVQSECPSWASPALQARFGDAFITEMLAMLEQAPLDLRINPIKIKRGDAIEQLRKERVEATACPYSPLGIRVTNRPSLANLALLKDGSLEIQDEGSQLVAQLVDAKPGQRVVDFCAGAGGKTLAIASQMENKGNIIACDTHATRLTQGKLRFRKAGFHNVETRVLANENDPWIKKHKAGFDHVLVDAPCSGSGTWRRNPDARWNELGPGIANLVPLQTRILQSASRLVKAGGRLVYATCSLLPEENEAQISNFLSHNPNFKVIDIHGVLGDKAPNSGPYLSLTPHQHNTDGFFAAVMEKSE